MTLRSLTLAVFAAVAIAARWRYRPWPELGEAPVLDLVAAQDPALYWALRAWVWLLPAAAVAVAGSFALAAWDVWGPRLRAGGGRSRLPAWPLGGDEAEPAIVVGEQHHPVDPVEVQRPEWLTVPAHGLFTGTAIFGATGSGKTAACMRPFVVQLFSWQAGDEQRRCSGLVLEVKGDFCHQVRDVLAGCGREGDYVELGIGSDSQWNPLDSPSVDSYSLAYQIASLLAQLFGKGKDPFWQQASTNLLRNIIELHRIHGARWVTLRDLYRCAIDSGRLMGTIEAARSEILGEAPMRVRLEAAAFRAHMGELGEHGPWHPDGDGYEAPMTRDLLDLLENAGLDWERVLPDAPAVPGDAAGRLEAFEVWLKHDWANLKPDLRTSIVEGVSSFLGLFDSPDVARVFCPGPPLPPGGPAAPGTTFSGEVPGLLKRLPPLRDLIEGGKVLCLNMPVAGNDALARVAGVMLKTAWLKAALGRPADMAADPGRYFRPAVFLCDEYQSFATVGEDDPAGDEKAFPLTRQSRVIPIVATQSLASLQSVTRGGAAWKTLLQSFRTRIFLSLSDTDSCRLASEMCGTVERIKASWSFNESSGRAAISLLSGRAGGARGSVGAGRSYQSRREARFHPADFQGLNTCEAIVLPFDGQATMPARRVYLKPWFLPADLGYWDAVRQGRLGRADGSAGGA